MDVLARGASIIECEIATGTGRQSARVLLQDGDPRRVGCFRLTARLGSGGIGRGLPRPRRDGRLVAVKLTRPELADDPEFRARFAREVAVLARVRVARIVRVIEAGTDACGPFLVTEYAAGPSPASHVESAGPLDAGMLYDLAAGLADALSVIHAAGVVHRDLKPSNVIMTADGPKVIDFGIAQVLDSVSLTRTGTTIGSVGFMAPEQFTGQVVPAADVFAWAVTVTYAASGVPPFGTGPTAAVAYRIVHDQPDLVAVPDALRPVVEAALAKSPQDRPAAHETLDQLTAAPAGACVSARTPTVLSPAWPTTWSRAARPIRPGLPPTTGRRRPGRWPRSRRIPAYRTAACSGRSTASSPPAARSSPPAARSSPPARGPAAA